MSARGPLARAVAALRRDEGSAVVEFPLIAALIVVIAVTTLQVAVIMHTRNSLTDAAVQGAHHASLIGNAPQDGAERAVELARARLGVGYDVTATAQEDATGRITVQLTAAIPLVGLLGPSGTLVVEGHALDEDAT